MQKPNNLNQKNHASSLGLPNEGIERDLRGIAQKHDLGDQLVDDLLEMGKYADRFAAFKKRTKEKDTLLLETQGLSFLWSSEGKNKTSGLLRTPNVSFMLDGEETQEFISFLLEVSDQFKEPLKALRSQLGSL